MVAIFRNENTESGLLSTFFLYDFMKILKQFLWIFPFIFFLFGYFCISQIISNKAVSTPALLGKSLDEALKIASSLHLNLRIIAEKEDDELPANIIINQVPQLGQQIKSGQVIFCVISKKPVALMMPSFTQLPIHELKEFAQDHSVAYKLYCIPTKYPAEKIIAHIPRAQNSITKSGIIAYVSTQERKQSIVPDFKNKSIADVKDLIIGTALTLSTHHDVPMPESHDCHNCVIIDQRPLPGSLIYLDQPLNLMFSVIPLKK